MIGSSLEIATSTIVNNVAETGEVISECNSDISVSDELFINTTVTKRATTSQPTEPSVTTSVFFELNSKVYPNNSIIPLSEVGEYESALLCKTDLVICCGTPSNQYGVLLSQW